MNSQQDIIRRKVVAFTEEECVEKLIAELSEALEAARDYLCSLRCERKDAGKTILRRKHLAEELADVDVAGILTFSEVRPFMREVYNTKVAKGVFEQMKTAVEQRENRQSHV